MRAGGTGIATLLIKSSISTDSKITIYEVLSHSLLTPLSSFCQISTSCTEPSQSSQELVGKPAFVTNFCWGKHLNLDISWSTSVRERAWKILDLESWRSDKVASNWKEWIWWKILAWGKSGWSSSNTYNYDCKWRNRKKNYIPRDIRGFFLKKTWARSSPSMLKPTGGDFCFETATHWSADLSQTHPWGRISFSAVQRGQIFHSM